MKLARNFSITIICVILGIMLAWQYKSIYNNNKVSASRNLRYEELQEQYFMTVKDNEALRKKIDELNKEVSILENSNEVEKELKDRLNSARILTGLTDVKGKGVKITLDNGDYSEFGNFRDDNEINEYDLLQLINELKASEAQAIAVNGERIVAMSEIKRAGSYFVINSKQILPPFTIEAIADPDKIENALNMLGGVFELFEYHNYKVSFEKKDNIVIPKVRDDGTVLKYDLLKPVE